MTDTKAPQPTVPKVPRNSGPSVFISCLTLIGVVLMLPVFIVTGMLWSGWIISVLWRWFVTPEFHWAPISVAEAIGLTLVVALTRETRDISNDKYKDKPKWYAFVVMCSKLYLAPAFVLFIGWIVQMFR